MFQEISALQRITFIALLCFAVASIPLFGQRSTPQVYKILGISVEGLNPKNGTTTESLVGHSGLKIGDEVSIPGDAMRKAIHQLWALRIFSDIQILSERQVENGVYLLIKVKEHPRIERVETKGQDDVSEEDILKKANITRGQILTPEDIIKIVENVKALYEEEGHLLAEITPSTYVEDSTKSTSVVLRLSIDEGPGVTIGKISATGATAFTADDIKSELEDTKEKTWWNPFSHPKFDKKKFEADKQKVQKFYRKNGYLDFEILSDSTWYSEDKQKINIVVNLHEGPQYKVHKISWEGNTVYSSEVLTGRLQFYSGDIYNEERFEQNLRGNPDNTDVGSLYLDNGYLQFRLEPEVQRIAADSVDIVVHVFERNQFRLRQIDIVGNKKTRENVIRRELFTKPGDYFSRAAVIRSLRQLQQLNYFNPEKLKPEPHMADDENVDLTYEVEEKSSDNVNASVGYSGAFGVTGALGFTINNFSIAEPLQGGAGQILNFDWQFGEGARIRTFTIGFTEPWLYDSPTTLGLSLYDTRQIYTSYTIQQTGLSIRVGRGRLKWPDNYFRIDWTFRMLRNNVDGNVLSNYIYNGRYSQFALVTAVSRNSIDSPIFPSSGSSVSLSFEFSGGILPGDVEYHKWMFNADWFTPLLSSNRVVLATSSIMGYIDPFNTHTIIPPTEFFYMGGTGLGYASTTQLRGYEDQSVGPRDYRGFAIGGRVMMKYGLELRMALSLNPIPIYFLMFAEAGNVYTDFYHANFLDLKRSVGIGARLLIQPIGLIGFDYGYGLDHVLSRDGGPDGWHFHFQFGRGF